MKKLAFLLFLVSLCAANLRADDQVAAVQQALKDQGFYYGQVDGQGGPETTAAIRRYQIRNGLQVDGTLNKETLDSLKIAGNPQLPPPPAPLDGQQQPAPRQPPPPPPQDVSQNDRDFLNKQNGAPAATPAPPPPPDNTNIVSPPQPQPQPQGPSLATQFAVLYARTPYQNAPLEVQQGTLRNAQAILARAAFYNGPPDGLPGPMTTRAITAFQADDGLAQSGRLDLQTLSALRLLPNQAAPPAPVERRVIIQPFFPAPRFVPPPRRRVWGD